MYSGHTYRRDVSNGVLGLQHLSPYPHPFESSIIRIPVEEQHRLAPDVPIEFLFPKVRALFAEYIEPFSTRLLDLFAKLTFLSLQLGKRNTVRSWLEKDDPARSHHIILQLPTLKTLHVELFRDQYEGIDFIEQWDMPLLAHVQLCIPSNTSWPTSPTTFFRHIGEKLKLLCISMTNDYVELPDGFWEMMPGLVYLGVTAFRPELDIPQPPHDHALRTLALLEEKEAMVEPRENASLLAGRWKMLDRISDSHTWEDLPSALWKPITSQDIELGFLHIHGGTHCWQCINLLHSACQRYGIRYEDRAGRPFSGLKAGVIE
ncbi:hypothetical protein M408DRAFT_10623 [Serendipita vermifera MAFF 305830]|uniref:F-box domain-containing protein n=1 Tax=Serendipita vermifera MAFF 305830 TaxID=933852 RepID=A0A0C3AKK0_SERVB|nr:hypothetical protein M408DRAFT_10623 [Serendipita vermifera MAFF 305830]